MCFRPTSVIFLAKTRKVLKVAIVRKTDDESNFSRKKFVHFLKRFLYENGKAQYMLLVAGRFVPFCLKVILQIN